MSKIKGNWKRLGDGTYQYTGALPNTILSVHLIPDGRTPKRHLAYSIEYETRDGQKKSLTRKHLNRAPRSRWIITHAKRNAEEWLIDLFALQKKLYFSIMS